MYAGSIKMTSVIDDFFFLGGDFAFLGLLQPHLERVAIDALQLCCLLLPPPNRRKLQLLMRMISRTKSSCRFTNGCFVFNDIFRQHHDSFFHIGFHKSTPNSNNLSPQPTHTPSPGIQRPAPPHLWNFWIGKGSCCIQSLSPVLHYLSEFAQIPVH